MGKIGLLIAVGALALVGFSCVGGYNDLNRLDQAVNGQWAQVQNAYQRRADLIPNLVETVKGAANFEKGTYVAVAEARARVGQASAPSDKLLNDPEAFKKWQQAQGELSGALSRLLVVSEQYPDLKATAAFRDLMAQLEGSENRITVERMRFNEAAQAFNTRRSSFPTVILASLMGSRFAHKPYFQATAGSEVAPKVKF